CGWTEAELIPKPIDTPDRSGPKCSCGPNASLNTAALSIMTAESCCRQELWLAWLLPKGSDVAIPADSRSLSRRLVLASDDSRTGKTWPPRAGDRFTRSGPGSNAAREGDTRYHGRADRRSARRSTWTRRAGRPFLGRHGDLGCRGESARAD